MTVTPEDLSYLRRCVELAREALEDGDEPFGSLLVSAAGEVLFEDRNRVKAGDATRHPELEISRWAAAHWSAHRGVSGPAATNRAPTDPHPTTCGVMSEVLVAHVLSEQEAVHFR